MEKLDVQKTEKEFGDHSHIVGKQFKHNVSGIIVEIDSVDFISNIKLIEAGEIVVIGRKASDALGSSMVEEINYFLGSYRQIN